MNIQTERLENHIARLTVEIEDKQWQQAKEKSAKELSRQYKIPGFRKGKAPYKIVAKFLGEGSIENNAIEKLGSEIYKDVLEQAEVNPYTSGVIEDFQREPKPTYIFSVPLQPEVTLSDYREIRHPFEEPEVADEQVEEALRELQQEHALVEDSAQPIQLGDRVTVDVHSEFSDEAPEAGDEDEEDEEKPVPAKGDQYFHRHDAELTLDPEREPLLPGFNDALVGANIGDDVVFELTVPTDDEDYAEIAGRKVEFNVTVNSVQNVTLPELNDDFAARVTEDEDEPLTLLQLRVRTREKLQEEANRTAESEYANLILDKIVEQSTIVFPDAMISDRVHEMIQDFERSLMQNGIDLEAYQKITGTTHEQFHEMYHDDAVQSLERSLTLGELLSAENITITDDDITAQIEETLAQFGEQAAFFRQYLDTPEQRQNLASNLLFERIMQRLVKIGRGESLEEETEIETEDTSVEASADVVETEATEEPTDETESVAEPVDDESADEETTTEPDSESDE